MTSSTTSGFSSVAPGTDSPEDLQQFVAAFKEMASSLDEDGARNLLMWSPLFMPTVEGLMNTRYGSQGPKPRLKAGVPREAKHAPPRSRPSSAAAQRQAHIAKLQALYAGGGGGGGGGDDRGACDGAAGGGSALPGQVAGSFQSVHGAASMQGPSLDADPARSTGAVFESAVHTAEAPLGKPGAGFASQPPGSPWVGAQTVPKLPVALEDDWEEEVDDLLNWTTTLPVPDL